MDKNLVIEKLKAHAEAARQAGKPDVEVEQALSKATQMPTANMGGFPTQTSTYGPANVSQGMEGRVNPGPPQPMATSQPQQPQQTDISQILKSIEPTMGQGIANAMSVIGGGKPIYEPDMGRQLIKSAAFSKMLTPNYQTVYGPNGEVSYVAAPQGHVIASPANMTPTGQASGAALTNRTSSMVGLNQERARGLRQSNDFLQNAMSGQGQGGQNGSNFVVTGTGPRGATTKNLTAEGQMQTIRQGGKGYAIQDAKVDQANHLKAMLDQNFDRQTGQYNVKAVPYQELAMGLATLVSNSNNTSQGDRDVIAQKTAQGDINGLITFLTGVPQNAAPQEIIIQLAHAIDRQGQVAQYERDNRLKSLGINQQYGNSYGDYGQGQDDGQQFQPQSQQQVQGKNNDPLGIR